MGTTLLDKLWYLLSNYYPLYLDGIKNTIIVAIVGTFFGLILAFILVLARSFEIHFKDNMLIKFIKQFVNFIAVAYIDIIRGTPMLVQAAIFYYGIGTKVFDLSVLQTAFVVVSFNTAAYIAEILRSGILALGKNQVEAGESLGLSKFQILRTIIYPQAIKNSLPALSNELIVNIKDSSVLSVIGLGELFYNSKAASSANYLIEESFILVAIIYFIITFTLTRLLGVLINGKKISLSSQTVPEVVNNGNN